MNIITLRRSRLFRVVVVVLLITALLFIATRSTTPGLDQTFRQSAIVENGEKSGEKRNQLSSFASDKLGNFEPLPQKPRSGPGEGGKSHILRPDQRNEASQSVSEFGINMVASEEISLSRTIKDTRVPECKHWSYPENLPKVSVVIVFHNEGWSTLLRTVQSVIDRSPPQFLEEVLLVDDFSDKGKQIGKFNEIEIIEEVDI